MMICITAQGDTMESKVDPRFGRCAYFIIADPQSSSFEAIANDGINAAGAAGIKAGTLMADKNIKTVLTGNVGPNAYDTLKAAGVEVITGISGTVKEALALYREGGLKSTANATVASHDGMK